MLTPGQQSTTIIDVLVVAQGMEGSLGAGKVLLPKVKGGGGNLIVLITTSTYLTFETPKVSTNVADTS